MTDNYSQMNLTRHTHSQLADIVSGFKAVLIQSGIPEATTIECTFVNRKLESEDSSVLPQGCKYKCWYNQSKNSTQCGIVCSVTA
ncbi:hypothetical protein [Limnofasciculus baicalensis]|uniref:Uncharacterized protein n=1 Tax=Limnofasciculus baicalensis BBK-W-15 TaxID=2699891 RepID=A0AAE3GTH8_9CYAN|nr:hypothetical protein [Limnofasciculus baicalensis]MCP2730445.1 hypothetical protein [Limnofasciculus baicalensis BBK-W-15]